MILPEMSTTTLPWSIFPTLTVRVHARRDLLAVVHLGRVDKLAIDLLLRTGARLFLFDERLHLLLRAGADIAFIIGCGGGSQQAAGKNGAPDCERGDADDQ
ncbi:MAG: hypothetical protein WKH64_18240 [Chloroflexia bacterium]